MESLPAEYGPWSSCYNRFNRWTAKGIWEQIWNALKDEIGHENYAIDGSISRPIKMLVE